MATDEPRRTAVLAGLVLVAFLSTLGCGGGDPVPPSDAAASTATLPQASDAAILAVSGALEERTSLDVGLDGLATLPQVDVGVHDPYEERDMAFQGVLLLDLLDAVGVAPSATSIRLVALDDYVVELPLEEIGTNAVIATATGDGAGLTIEDGGPIRLVFTSDDGVGGVPNNWIRSIATMELR